MYIIKLRRVVMYSNQYYQPTMQNPIIAQNIRCIKDYFKKPIVLVLGILLAANTILSVISSFLSETYLAEIYNSVSQTLDGYDYTTKTVNQSGSMVASIISIIITGIFISSFFIIYFKSRNNNPLSNPSAGFTIIKVFSIIYLVFVCLVTAILAIAEIFLIIFTIGVSDSYSYGTFNEIMTFTIFLLGAVLLIMVFAIFWISSVIKLVSSINKGLKKPLPLSDKGAMSTGVLLIIMIIFSALSIISLILMQFIFAEIGSDLFYSSQNILDSIDSFTKSGSLYIAIISQFLNMAIFILYAVIALGYRKHIRSHAPVVQVNSFSANTNQEHQAIPAQPYMPSYNQTPQYNQNNAYGNPSYNQNQFYNNQNSYQPQENSADHNISNEPSAQASSAQASEAFFKENTMDLSEVLSDLQSTESVNNALNDNREKQPTCPKCGAAVNGNCRFCENCGEKLQ